MQELLEQIETWTEANGIKILNGFNASDNGENIIVCKDEELEQFLDIALANNINHLVIDKSLFNLDKALEAVINRNLRKLGRDVEELKNSFKKNLKNFEKYNDEIFHVSIEWQKEGFSYLFEQYASFYEDFIEEIEALKTEWEGIKIASQPKALPQKDYNFLVDTIAASDKYFKNHTQP